MVDECFGLLTALPKGKVSVRLCNCYPAFQLGVYDFAYAMLGGGDS